ncbi:adh_short domain-containing protein, partial [Cephalotus follicularis]
DQHIFFCVLKSTLCRLEVQVALITGGARGIGECTARVFAKHGAKVVIADMQGEQGHLLCKALDRSNPTYVHCDVTNEDQIKNVVDKTLATHGKLDIMFNNIGIADEYKARIIDNENMILSVFSMLMSPEFNENHLYKCYSNGLERASPIVTIASISSHLGGASSHAYCFSEHAVVGLTRNAAVELGQFMIRVNCSVCTINASGQEIRCT